MQEKTYTTFQIAAFCGVRPTTIIKWVNENKIKAYTTVGGHRRILQSDLLHFLTQYKLPIPEELSKATKHVLIVEDDPAVGQLLRKALQKALNHVEIEWIKNGIEALLILGKSPPDLIILDVLIPVVDGARILATLRSDIQTRKIKVIGITGERLPPEKLKFMQSYTDAFYFKPFDVNELVNKTMVLLDTQKTGLRYRMIRTTR